MTPLERPENTATDRQMDAEPFGRDGRTGCRCVAVKANGERCKARPMSGSTLCSLHTPGLASERGRRGGLLRPRTPRSAPRPRPVVKVAPDSPVAKLPDVKIESAADAAALLVDTMNQLRRGEIDVQVGNTLLRMIQTAAKVVVQVDLERKFAELKAELDAQKTSG